MKKGWFHRMPIAEIKEMVQNEGEGLLKTAFEIRETKLPEASEEEIAVTDDIVFEKENIKEEFKFPVVEEDTAGLENQMVGINEDYTKIAKELEIDEKRRIEVEEKQDEFVEQYLKHNLKLNIWREKEFLTDPKVTQEQKRLYKKKWSPKKIKSYKELIQTDVRELLRGMGNSSPSKKDAHSYMRMINFLKNYTKKIKSEKHKDHKKYEKYKYLVDTLLKPAE
jgi:hypothetical protein